MTLNKYFLTPSPVTSPLPELVSPLSFPSPNVSEYSRESDGQNSSCSPEEVEASTVEDRDPFFQLPPPVDCEVQEGGLKPVVKVHTDWSRSTREHLSLLKCASDSSQSKITSYFEVCVK